MIFKPTVETKENLTIEEKSLLLQNIEIHCDELLFTAKAKIKDLDSEKMIEKEEIIAEFEFYKDEENKVWANKIVSYGIYQGIGIGTQIIKIANEKFGEIYFSNATQSEKAMFSKDKGNDFRYFSNALKFEESIIGLFVSSLIKRGIIKYEQIQNPYTK
jgi:hypothetical protein